MFKLSNSTRLVVASGFIICTLLLGSAFSNGVRAAHGLGTAESFAVLAYSTVTNTGETTVRGNLGVSPGEAVTGNPTVTNGSIHAGDEVARQARSDASTAYTQVANHECLDTNNLTGKDLGGMTLTPGVYCFSSSAQLTGTLTLDAQGSSNAQFIFQIGSTLTTASGSSVVMIGGSHCNVFWQVGSSATLGTSTTFRGNILAYASITLKTGANVMGRALALNEAVTMDNNVVDASACMAAQDPATATPTPPDAATATPTVGSPATSTPTPVTPVGETTTSTPVTPAPGTSTPVTPVTATSTPVAPAPEPPALTGSPTATPTLDVPPVATGTPTTPATGTPTSETPTPVTPVVGTSTPETPTTATATPETPSTGTPTTATPVTPAAGTPTPVTPVTATPTPATPGSWPPSTPTATGTPSTIVTFPNTGSGGLLTTQTDGPVALGTLAINLALVVLLTGALGMVVERQSRRYDR